MVKSKFPLLIIGMLLALGLVSTGCVNLGGGKETTTTKGCGYVGGNDAVVLKVYYAPTEIFEGDTATITISVENIGESTVQSVTLNLIGLPSSMNPGGEESWTQSVGPLDPRRVIEGDIVPGGIEFVDFNIKAPEVTADFPVSFSIRGEYTYTAEGMFDLCIRDMSKRVENPICEPTGTRFLCHASSPVKITEVVESPGGSGKIRFTLKIQDVGSGSLGGPLSFHTTANENLKYVYLRLMDLNGNDLSVSCSPVEQIDNNGEKWYAIKMYGDAATVTCTYDISGRSGIDVGYIDIIKFNLRFKYDPELSLSMIIRDIGQ